jgi:hypothetical protein
MRVQPFIDAVTYEKKLTFCAHGWFIYSILTLPLAFTVSSSSSDDDDDDNNNNNNNN